MSGILGRFIGGDQLKQLSKEKERLTAEIERLNNDAAASSQAAGRRSVTPFARTQNLEKAQQKLNNIQKKWKTEAAKSYAVLRNIAILESKVSESDPALKNVLEFIEQEIMRFNLAEPKKGVTIPSPSTDLKPRIIRDEAGKTKEDVETKQLLASLRPLLDKLSYQLILGENKSINSDEVQALFALLRAFGFTSNDAELKKMFSSAIEKGYITENSDSYKILLCIDKLSKYVRANHMTDGFGKEMTEFHAFGTEMLKGLDKLQINANAKDFCKPEEKEAKDAAYLAARDELDKIYLSFNPLLQELEKKGIDVKFEAHRGVTRFIADHEKERNAIKQVHSQADLNKKVKVAFYFAVINDDAARLKFWREVGAKLGIDGTVLDQIQRTPGKFAQEQNLPISYKNEFEPKNNFEPKNEFEQTYREQDVIAAVDDSLPVQQEKAALLKEAFIARESGNEEKIAVAIANLNAFAKRQVEENPLVVLINSKLASITNVWEQVQRPAKQSSGLHFSYGGNTADKLQDFKEIYELYKKALLDAAKNPDGKNNFQLNNLEQNILDKAADLGNALKIELKKQSSVHGVLFDTMLEKVKEASELRSQQKGFSRSGPSNLM